VYVKSIKIYSTLKGTRYLSLQQSYKKIKIPREATPVNVRQYRLPYAHRQVIIEQMGKLKDTLSNPQNIHKTLP